ASPLGALTQPRSPEIEAIELAMPLEARSHPRFEEPLRVGVREAKLLCNPPWVRSLGKIALEVSTQGWRFPPPCEPLEASRPRLFEAKPQAEVEVGFAAVEKKQTRLRPANDTVVFKERLLYMLQPPLENFFAGRQVQLPFPP